MDANAVEAYKNYTTNRADLLGLNQVPTTIENANLTSMTRNKWEERRLGCGYSGSAQRKAAWVEEARQRQKDELSRSKDEMALEAEWAKDARAEEARQRQKAEFARPKAKMAEEAERAKASRAEEARKRWMTKVKEAERATAARAEEAKQRHMQEAEEAEWKAARAAEARQQQIQEDSRDEEARLQRQRQKTEIPGHKK